VRSFDVLLLTRPGELNSGERHYSVDLSWNEKIILPFGTGEIELRALNSSYINCDTVKEDSQFSYEVADLRLDVLSTLGTRLQVRNWRPGDGFVRAGHQKQEKIKSLFQESQVFLWQRRHWPVATMNDEIFWSRKFGPSARCVAGSGSRIARLTYRTGKESIWL
jgi:tRNA(Ile)-lysidine synthetase-like protein